LVVGDGVDVHGIVAQNFDSKVWAGVAWVRGPATTDDGLDTGGRRESVIGAALTLAEEMLLVGAVHGEGLGIMGHPDVSHTTP
jgi:hypothetical protein